MITQERLKELLHYDPETGIFTWKTSRGGSKKGDIAGCINTPGYRTISVDRGRYNASRLAWLFVEGYFPENDIDHKDNKSGITGVSWNKEKQKWRVRVAILGKEIFLGHFTKKIDAAMARWRGEVKHGPLGCNTTSSAYRYIQKHGNQCAIS